MTQQGIEPGLCESSNSPLNTELLGPIMCEESSTQHDPLNPGSSDTLTDTTQNNSLSTFKLFGLLGQRDRVHNLLEEKRMTH